MIPIVGSKILRQHSNKDISVKYKELASKEINLKKESKHKHKRFILVRSSWLTSVPKPPAWDFVLTFDFVHPKSTHCIPLDKSPLSNLYNSSYKLRRRQYLVQPLFNPKTLLYNAPLWVTTIYPISLESVCDREQGLL